MSFLSKMFSDTILTKLFYKLGGYNATLGLNDLDNADEIEVIINKKASDFSFGKFVVIDNNDEIIKNPTPQQQQYLKLLNNKNNVEGRTKFLYNHKYNQHKYGVSFTYFKGKDLKTIPLSYIGIDNNLLTIKYINQNFLSVSTQMDYIDEIYIMNIELNKELVLVTFDTSFDFKTFAPKIRRNQIKNKVRLLANTNEALVNAMKRTQLMLLVPDNGNNPMTDVARVVAPVNTDAHVLEQKEQFKEDFSIKHGSVTYLNKAMKTVDTNPDNGKLKAMESFNHGFENVSLMYGIDARIVKNQTKYDDMELILKQYVATIQQEGDELGESLSNYFETEQYGFKIGLDYTGLKDLLIKENIQNDGNI